MWANEVTLCYNYLQVTLGQGAAPVCLPDRVTNERWSGKMILFGGSGVAGLTANQVFILSVGAIPTHWMVAGSSIL